MDPNVLFEGKPTSRGAGDVTYGGQPLGVYLNEVNHSPDGFQWGYNGSGPAQLAYAILRRTTKRMFDNDQKSQYWSTALYQKFKQEVIARLPQGQSWFMGLQEVILWIANNDAELRKEWNDVKST